MAKDLEGKVREDQDDLGLGKISVSLRVIIRIHWKSALATDYKEVHKEVGNPDS